MSMTLPFDGEPVARTTDPVTSHAAAASVNPTTSDRARWVLLAVLAKAVEQSANVDQSAQLDDDDWLSKRSIGVADHDLVPLVQSVLTISPSGVRTRRSELVVAGLVRSHPTCRDKTPGGRDAHVWVPTGAGWRMVQADAQEAVHRRVRTKLVEARRIDAELRDRAL